MKKHLLSIIVFCTFLLLAGCSAGYVTTQPADVRYDRGVAPGAGYIWIDGDWMWSGGAYRWHEGHWGMPRGGRSWQRGSWQSGRGGYRWQRGHWR